MKVTNQFPTVVQPFVLTVIGLSLTTVMLVTISPSQPGQYTTGWLLSPFVGLAGVVATGYAVGRVAASKRSGYVAAIAGVAVFVTALVLVYAGNWVDGPLDYIKYAYFLVAPIVLALMLPSFAIARRGATRKLDR